MEVKLTTTITESGYVQTLEYNGVKETLKHELTAWGSQGDGPSFEDRNSFPLGFKAMIFDSGLDPYDTARALQKKVKKFEAYKKAVAKESKHYDFLKKNNGVFNEGFLLAAFDSGQTPTECCNSMTEVV